MRNVLPLAFFFAAGLCLTAGAQTIDDALRYSEYGTFGTARSLGTSNSMSAIGADFTALQSNPAGLAAYRFNEFALTLGGVVSGTRNPELNGLAAGESQSDFRIALPQASLVFTRQPIGSRWTQVNFGVGISQTNRLEETISFSGDLDGSITDRWLETSNNFYDPGSSPIEPNNLNAFDDGPAFDASAIREFADIDPFLTEDALYTSDYDQQRLVNQEDESLAPVIRKSANIRRRGRASSIDFSIAGNYDEKLLIGATLGLARSNFRENNTYREVDDQEAVEFFDELRYTQTTLSDGSGILGRIGAIYRASQAIRIGLAYHSPTVLSLTENYSTSLRYVFTDGGGPSSNDAASPEPQGFDYKIVSPSQYRASVGVIIGKAGFVGAEAGYVNYAGSKFKIADGVGLDDLERQLNDLVDEAYQSSVQLRVGGEINVAGFQARLGGEYLGAPFAEEKAALGFSAGLGYRRKRLFADLGYKMNFRPARTYQPYTVELEDFTQPRVTYTPTLSLLALTVGIKFGS